MNLACTSGQKHKSLHLRVFEYAEFKNGRNQIVALGFTAKNLKFKMAALKTGCACNLAINAPILVVQVSVYMFMRSRNSIRHISNVKQSYLLTKILKV